MYEPKIFAVYRQICRFTDMFLLFSNRECRKIKAGRSKTKLFLTIWFQNENTSVKIVLLQNLICETG